MKTDQNFWLGTPKLYKITLIETSVLEDELLVYLRHSHVTIGAYSPCTCFVAANHWFLMFSVMYKSCLIHLYIAPCHMVSAEIAVAMAVPIENPADCEVRGVIHFLQADEILSYLAKEASFHMELFSCMTMHVRLLPSRHKPCCMSNSIGTSSSILYTVRTWHRRTFSKIEGAPCW